MVCGALYSPQIASSAFLEAAATACCYHTELLELWGRGGIGPQVFSRSVNLISTRGGGADCACHITCVPPPGLSDLPTAMRILERHPLRIGHRRRRRGDDVFGLLLVVVVPFSSFFLNQKGSCFIEKMRRWPFLFRLIRISCLGSGTKKMELQPK